MILEKTDFHNSSQKIVFKKESQEIKKKNRITSLVFFLGTVFLSGFFMLSANIKTWWQGLFKPAVYQIVKPSDKVLGALTEYIGFKPDLESLSGLKKSINLLLGNLNGTYGIYYYQFKGDEFLGINEDEVFTAASVNKVPIMVSFFEEVEKGRLSEDEVYVLAKKDVQNYGTGQMRYQPFGTKYQYIKLVELSSSKSDNTAAFVLETIIGRQKIQNRLTKLGMVKTILKDNTTTPKETADYFVLLYENKLIKPENKEKIIKFLTNTDFEDRISKGVPKNIKVAHKIGNETNTSNDCGIVFGPKPYVLCVLSKEASEPQALEAIPKISRLVFEFVNK